MVDSILIGKIIYEKLTQSEELKEYVGENIFPLVAEESVTYPFVIFYRNSIRSLSNKDGFSEDEVSFSILTVSDRYTQTLEIANIIRGIFEKQRIGNIYNCKLENVDEDFAENAFIQLLTFTCRMTN